MEQGMYEVIKINYIKEMKNYSTLSCFG